jgi:acetyl esterase
VERHDATTSNPPSPAGRAGRRGRARVYLERGQPVEVLIWWAGRGPRNVLIRRGDGDLVVRPFRGLRRPAAAEDGRT